MCVCVCVCVCVYKYKVYSKSIKTKAVFVKTEINNEWNINFLRNTSLDIQHTYSREFSIN